MNHCNGLIHFFISNIKKWWISGCLSNNLQNASLFAIIANAFIGSAPGSTGSGVKLTTMAIFLRRLMLLLLINLQLIFMVVEL